MAESKASKTTDHRIKYKCDHNGWPNIADLTPRDEAKERQIWEICIDPVLKKCGLSFNFKFVPGDYTDIDVFRSMRWAFAACNKVSENINVIDILINVRYGLEASKEQIESLGYFFIKIFKEDRILLPAFIELVSQTMPFSDDLKTIKTRSGTLFPCGDGVRWKNIAFAIKADDLVLVKTPNGEARLHYSELGFSDKRTGDRPNKTTWPLFQVFALSSGEISSENPYSDENLSDRARRLNQHLQKTFGIKESIFTENYKRFKRYKTKFIISDQRLK